MRITKCDNCKRARPNDYQKRAGWTNIDYTGNPMSVSLDLCTNCAKKVIVFSRLEKLLREDKK